jgi:pyruvate dehydrogenase kinase 2/3/4
MHEGPVGTNMAAERAVWAGRESVLGNGTAPRLRIPIERRYFSPPSPSTLWPPEVHEYNESFTNLLQNIKKRHDPTVTTVAQGVLEWKRKRRAGPIGQSIQEWLDRFYMSRIGIRFLIGQRESGGVKRRLRGCGWDRGSWRVPGALSAQREEEGADV